MKTGTVRIQGTFDIDEDYQDRFSEGNKGETLLAINSGTIELKENKIIILAD